MSRVERRRHDLYGRVRRRLYYRGALAAVVTLYGVLAVTVPGSAGVHVPAMFEGLFGAAVLFGIAAVKWPRSNIARHGSAITAVTAPAARALTIATVAPPLPTDTRITATVAWALIAFFAYLVWPLILPPHIDAGRLAETIDY